MKNSKGNRFESLIETLIYPTATRFQYLCLYGFGIFPSPYRADINYLQISGLKRGNEISDDRGSPFQR